MRKKSAFLLTFAMFVLLMMPMAVSAKSSNPYKDVTLRTVDKQSFTAISYVKKLNGWKGLITKGKLSPNKYMTRREFLIVLHNLYGSKVAVTMADVRGANNRITSKFVCDRMVVLSKALKYPIRWTGTKAKMKRKDVARYIYIFATFNSALKPK